HPPAHQTGRHIGQAVVVTACPAVLDNDIAALDEAALLETAAKRLQQVHRILGRTRAHESDHRHCRLLPSRALHLDREQQTAAPAQSNELTPLLVRHGDFLPYASSAPPTDPCTRFSGTISLP